MVIGIWPVEPTHGCTSFSMHVRFRHDSPRRKGHPANSTRHMLCAWRRELGQLSLPVGARLLRGYVWFPLTVNFIFIFFLWRIYFISFEVFLLIRCARDPRARAAALRAATRRPILLAPCQVVTMLQKMQEKVTAEGKKEQDLYDAWAPRLCEP